MGRTHVLLKYKLQSHHQRRGFDIQLWWKWRGCALSPPVFTFTDTPGVSLLPIELFLSVVLSLSVPSIHPCVQQLTGADPPADQFPQHVGVRSVLLCLSVLLISSPPAQETKEERKKETLAPPSLHSQAACASTWPSSPLASTASGVGWWKTAGREEEEEGWPNKKRGEGSGSGGWGQRCRTAFVSSWLRREGGGGGRMEWHFSAGSS